MASRRDVILAQVFSAIGRGAGSAPISDDAAAWLHDRYSPWLDKPVDGKTPQDVWETQSSDFLGKLAEIGKQAAATSGGGEISLKAAEASAVAVESDCTCPFCPANNP